MRPLCADAAPVSRLALRPRPSAHTAYLPGSAGEEGAQRAEQAAADRSGAAPSCRAAGRGGQDGVAAGDGAGRAARAGGAAAGERGRRGGLRLTAAAGGYHVSVHPVGALLAGAAFLCAGMRRAATPGALPARAWAAWASRRAPRPPPASARAPALRRPGQPLPDDPPPWLSLLSGRSQAGVAHSLLGQPGLSTGLWRPRGYSSEALLEESLLRPSSPSPQGLHRPVMLEAYYCGPD